MTKIATARGGLAKITYDTEDETWGGIYNTTVDMIDSALWGVRSVNAVAPGTTLAQPDFVDGDANKRVLVLVGSPTGSFNLRLPDGERRHVIHNKTGQFAFVFSGAASVYVGVYPGHITPVYCQGGSAFDMTPGGLGDTKMWDTNFSAIPFGWRLCDAQEGTMDGRGRYLRMAGANGVTPRERGGSAETQVETSEGGEHNHKGLTQGQALALQHLPRGDLLGLSSGTSSIKFTNSGTGGSYDINVYRDATTGREHAHGIDLGGLHSHTVDVEPLFLGVQLITRVALNRSL